MAPCTCMHAQPRGAMACLLQEGDGAAGPPLQDCLPLVHGQLRKGLHWGRHGQQHPWGRHGRCARARSQEEQQPAASSMGSRRSGHASLKALAAGRHGPAHHKQPPWLAPYFGGAFTSPGPQHVYACLPATLYALLRQLCQ